MGVNVTVEMDVAGLMERLQERVNSAQNMLTMKSKEHADYFTPMDSGMLKNNFEYTQDKHGAADGWAYKVPYAHRQFEGIRKDGSEFEYSVVVNSEACRRWTERAAQVFKDDIMKNVKEVLEA